MTTRQDLINAGVIKPGKPVAYAKSCADAIEARRREARCLTAGDKAMNILRAAVAASNCREAGRAAFELRYFGRTR